MQEIVFVIAARPAACDLLPVHTDLDKAELFNSYFNSVNVNDNGILPDFPTRVKSDMK